jgi:hypothetical protein
MNLLATWNYCKQLKKYGMIQDFKMDLKNRMVLITPKAYPKWVDVNVGFTQKEE